MKRIAWLAVLVSAAYTVAPTAQCGLTQPAAGTPELQSTWVLASLQVNGKPLPQTRSTLDLSFVGNRCVFGKMDGSYALRTNRQPKEIDMTFPGQGGKPYTFPAIYDLAGDTLTLCIQGSNRNRPTEFMTTAGDGRRLYRFHLVRPLKPGFVENSRARGTCRPGEAG